jgi:NAD(P)-dependent dehydrogenase (short-subunit alcohol dehydrogenase family)
MASRIASTKPTAKYYAVIVAFSSSVICFFGVRAFEIISLSITSPVQAICVAVSLIALISLFLVPPAVTSALIRRLGLVSLVIYSLKTEMDPALANKTEVIDLKNSICIVTGANSGVGYGITQLLVARGATVVMGCRSVKKCKEASSQIEHDVLLQSAKTKSTILPGSTVVMELNLGDFSSISNFVEDFSAKYDRVDVLVNNAGLFGDVGSRTVQGYETSLGVMHIGHFALTKWLMPLLLKPLPESQELSPFKYGARVVNVGSKAYDAGRFDASLMDTIDGTGDLSGEITDNCANFGPYNILSCCPLGKCPVTNGYARAKLANLLYAHELQKQSDAHALSLVRQGQEAPRRIVASVLHPGMVSTDIHWYFRAAGQFLRSRAQAAHIVLHAIQGNTFMPGSYIDSMGVGHDLFNFRDDLLKIHLEAFPDVAAAALPFIRRPGVETFSFELYSFKGKNLLGWRSGGSPPLVAAELVAEKLFQVTDRIVSQWVDENTKN